MQTYLAEADYHLHIAQILNLDIQHGDPDHPKRLISFSLYHCKISSKSAHNLLSNGQISNGTDSIVIWITTKV